MRGGGGNFGVAVTFEFNAHKVGPIVMCAAPLYPTHAAGDVMRAWRDWASTVPDEVTTRAIFWTMPASPLLPPAVHDQQVLILGAVYAGNADAGKKVLQPIREFATPLADISAQMPFRFFQAAFDPFFPKGGVASYWKSVYMDKLTDGAIDYIAKVSAARTSPVTLVHVPLLGGAMGRVAASGTAFGDRSAPYMLSVDGNWYEKRDAAKQIAWVRKVVADAAPFTSGGTYLNFTGDDQRGASALVRAAFGDNLGRLGALKTKYDSQNLFRLNNNVVPT